ATVVLLDGGYASTAVMPIEVFHSAGWLWNVLHEQPPEPAFRVRTVSLDGDAVRSAYGLEVGAGSAMAAVKDTDVVIISTSALDLDVALVENSALLPWLRRQHGRGAYVAGVGMGAAYV